MEKVDDIEFERPFIQHFRCGHILISTSPQGHFNKHCPDCNGYVLNQEQVQKPAECKEYKAPRPRRW
jgi:phage FluMu protein Com